MHQVSSRPAYLRIAGIWWYKDKTNFLMSEITIKLNYSEAHNRRKFFELIHEHDLGFEQTSEGFESTGSNNIKITYKP